MGSCGAVLRRFFATAAVAYFATAEAQSPENKHVIEASAAASAGRNVDAVVSYGEAVVASSRGNRDAYVGRAQLFESLGLPQLAARDLETATKIGPPDAGLLTSLCRDLALANHDLDGALAACDLAARLAPEDSAVLGARGYANLRRGAYPAAQNDFEAALNISSADPDYTFGRGVAMIHRGQTRDGRDEISIATLDRATLVSDWQVRGFGTQGEILQDRRATTAAQAAIATSDTIVILNNDEARVDLKGGCARILRIPSSAQREPVVAAAAASSWSGACRFGLIHGEGRLTPSPGAAPIAIAAVYGRSEEADGRDFATVSARLKAAYAPVEAALQP